MNYSYETDQIDRLGASDTYGIRIDNNGYEDSGKSSWKVPTDLPVLRAYTLCTSD